MMIEMCDLLEVALTKGIPSRLRLVVDACECGPDIDIDPLVPLVIDGRLVSTLGVFEWFHVAMAPRVHLYRTDFGFTFRADFFEEAGEVHP